MHGHAHLLTATGVLSGGYLFESVGFKATYLIVAALCALVAALTSLVVLRAMCCRDQRPGSLDESIVVDSTSGAEDDDTYVALFADVRVAIVWTCGFVAASVFALYEPTASIHFFNLSPDTTTRTSEWCRSVIRSCIVHWY